MDSDIIYLSDDDDDVQLLTVVLTRKMPPPPPPLPLCAKKSDPKSKNAAERPAFDRPCPKSKKKHYGNGDGDGASATRPAASATRPTASATRPAASSTRPVTAAVRPAAGSARPSAAAVAAAKYPPPYPKELRRAVQQASWEDVPPEPTMKLMGAGADGSIEIAWQMKRTVATQRWAKVKAYELYVCRETDAPPDASMWRMVDVIAGQPLPVGCVLVNCPPGVHYIALRAIDVHDRFSPFHQIVVTI